METTTPELYKYEHSRSLENQQVGQLRVAIQAQAGTGKTWAMLTFPNPVVLNFDRGLAAHVGKPNITEIPFYDDSFINKVLLVPNNTFEHRYQADRRPNRRDALTKFLHKEGHKFKRGQTLEIDSWTTVQNAFDIQEGYEPVISKRTGEPDTFAFWKNKIDYSTEIVELIKSFEADVVVTFHESPDRDSNGRIIGVKPLMQGQFCDQLGSHFTDWYRLRCIPLDLQNGLNELEKKELGNFPEAIHNGCGYVFQVQKDEWAQNCKTSRKNIPKGVRYIGACYRALMKYA